MESREYSILDHEDWHICNETLKKMHTFLFVNPGRVGTTASFKSHVKFPEGLDMHTNPIPRLSLNKAVWTQAKKTQVVIDKRQDRHNLGVGASTSIYKRNMSVQII